jgi:hypothetical protein
MCVLSFNISSFHSLCRSIQKYIINIHIIIKQLSSCKLEEYLFFIKQETNQCGEMITVRMFGLCVRVYEEQIRYNAAVIRDEPRER